MEAQGSIYHFTEFRIPYPQLDFGVAYGLLKYRSF